VLRLKNNAKSVGRRYLPPDEKRKARCIKMSDYEWQQIQKQAIAKNMSVSKYVRDRLLSIDS
jgi:alpha-D-ribose 1-methylphosphonate 5-triphosphate synthase subunit PhnG